MDYVNPYLYYKSGFQQKTSLDKRDTLEHGEQLQERRNELIEFLDYAYPFPNSRETIAQIICAFLNNQGGCIYIGITEEGVVRGLTLNRTDMDSLPKDILSYVANFYPSPKFGDLVTTKLLPVVQNGQSVRGCYVAKIIVGKGDPRTLYFASDKECISYIRNGIICQGSFRNSILSEPVRVEPLIQAQQKQEKQVKFMLPQVEEKKSQSPENSSQKALKPLKKAKPVSSIGLGLEDQEGQPEEVRKPRTTSQRDSISSNKDKSVKKESSTSYYQVALITPINSDYYELIVRDNIMGMESLVTNFCRKGEMTIQYPNTIKSFLSFSDKKRSRGVY